MLRRRTFLSAGATSCLAAANPALALARDAGAAAPSPRRTVRLQDGWRFSLGNASDVERDFGFGRDQRTFAKAGTGTADAAMAAFDDSGWKPVQVPHDWAVDLPFAAPANVPDSRKDAAASHGFKAIGRDYPQNSIGWYRIHLPVSADDRDRAVWIEFDGVFRDCMVFVNGYAAGENESGYTPFRVDIGDFLDYNGGPNVLTVRVDASLGEGWFYEGAGIYRNVTLVSAAPVHVPQWGVFVRDAGPQADGRILIDTEIAGQDGAAGLVSVTHRVIGPGGAMVAQAPASARGPGLFTARAGIAAPQLWSPDRPALYRLVTDVAVGGRTVDRVETPFGLRSIRFDAHTGFFLNGKSMKLLGTCNHHDHAGVGTGIPDALHAWRVGQVKSMGSNAWRNAHNPAAQALLDACDELGMMTIVEARLNSTSPEAMSELERMVRSSRNHPSVILWSVGNEEPHQGTPTGARISRAMVEQVKSLDATRPTTQAFDNGWGDGASRVVDVVGFNYRTDKIPAFHERFPDIPIIGTETGSTVSTRGDYANDQARHIVRAYDTEHPWWASTAEEWWPIVAEHDYIGGGFIWTGFDYRGEPTPFSTLPSISSYFGVMDMCGFAKDNFHYYRSQWVTGEPMVHLLPHWTWPGREGSPIEVWAYSNCAEVELLLNGRSLGRKAMPKYGHLEWQVPYAPGRLVARGYDGGGAVAEDSKVTAGAPASIRLTSDRQRLLADGRDLAPVRAEVLDAQGTPVPTASNDIAFAVAGPARVIGVGNGDPTSLEPDRATSRHAFNSLAQALVQVAGGPGRIAVTASSPGLSTGVLELFAHSQS